MNGYWHATSRKRPRSYSFDLFLPVTLKVTGSTISTPKVTTSIPVWSRSNMGVPPGVKRWALLRFSIKITVLNYCSNTRKLEVVKTRLKPAFWNSMSTSPKMISCLKPRLSSFAARPRTRGSLFHTGPFFWSKIKWFAPSPLQLEEKYLATRTLAV